MKNLYRENIRFFLNIGKIVDIGGGFWVDLEVFGFLGVEGAGGIFLQDHFKKSKKIIEIPQKSFIFAADFIF